MARSVFQTGTGKTAAVAAIASLLVAIAPNISNILVRRFPEAKADIEDTTSALVQILAVVGFVGGTGAIANRGTATDKVYSPWWLPGGFKKEDLEPVTKVVEPTVDVHRKMADLVIAQTQPVDPADFDRVNIPKTELLQPERYLA